jgi:hypothetical protein
VSNANLSALTYMAASLRSDVGCVGRKAATWGLLLHVVRPCQASALRSDDEFLTERDICGLRVLTLRIPRRWLAVEGEVLVPSSADKTQLTMLLLHLLLLQGSRYLCTLTRSHTQQAAANTLSHQQPNNVSVLRPNNSILHYLHDGLGHQLNPRAQETPGRTTV